MSPLTQYLCNTKTDVVVAETEAKESDSPLKFSLDKFIHFLNLT